MGSAPQRLRLVGKQPIKRPKPQNKRQKNQTTKDNTTLLFLSWPPSVKLEALAPRRQQVPQTAKMASPLSPIRAPRQLCGLCFVYRVSDEGDACDSCCSDSPATAAASEASPVSPPSQTLRTWLEQWKTAVDWWPDQFNYELRDDTISASFAASWKVAADAACEAKVAYLLGDLTDAHLEAVETSLQQLDDAAPSAREVLRAACIRAQTILELRLLIAESMPASMLASPTFIQEHTACSNDLDEARRVFGEWELEEMKAAFAARFHL